MELFQKRWQNYKSKPRGIKALKEKLDREAQLIAEGRVGDLKKKHPAAAEFGVIDMLSKADPSPNNKYLSWMFKHWVATMQQNFDDKGFQAFMANKPEEEMSPEEQTMMANLDQEMVASTNRVVNALEPVITFFHQNSDLYKSMQKREMISTDGPANDINSYEPGTMDILTITRYVKQEKQRREHEKTQAKRDSLKAKSESSIVYEDEHVRVIRPNTEHASCYYGKGTKWCISATSSQNYYNSYTAQGRAFYFMFWAGAPSPEHPYAKVAMVVDASDHYGDPQVEEYFDSPDDSQSASEVATGVRQMWEESGYDGRIEKEEDALESYDHVLEVIERVIQEAEEAAVDEATENRPGPKFEDFETILENNGGGYRGNWKYLDIYIDEAEGVGIYGRASMSIDLGALLKRYMNEKKVFLQWDPDFPENYNKEWIEENIEAWVLDWYKVNQSAEIYDVSVIEDGNQDWKSKDDLTVTLDIELDDEFLRDPDKFDELCADFAKDDANLEEYWTELFEDEEYFDIYKKSATRADDERVIQLSKYDEKYFPGGPEYKKDQMELPFDEEPKWPRDWEKFVKVDESKEEEQFRKWKNMFRK